MSHENGETGEDPIKTAVQEFLNQNPYPGFSQPFQLHTLDRFKHEVPEPKYADSYHLRLEGIAEKSLSIKDWDKANEWEEKLREVGKQFGVNLELPYWYFAK